MMPVKATDPGMKVRQPGRRPGLLLSPWRHICLRSEQYSAERNCITKLR